MKPGPIGLSLPHRSMSAIGETPGLTITENALLPEAPAVSEAWAADDADTELAKKTQNPIADLISVPFQNNFNLNPGTKDGKAVAVRITIEMTFTLI
jgi:hypothetical protein